MTTRTAGRELDMEVAEKVMGWRWWAAKNSEGVRRKFIEEPDWKPEDTYTPLGIEQCEVRPAEGEEPYSDAHRAVPRYSTSILDAWKLVERLRARFTNFNLHASNGWAAGFWNVGGDGKEYGGGSATADTPALAICLAALKAVGAIK